MHHGRSSYIAAAAVCVFAVLLIAIRYPRLCSPIDRSTLYETTTTSNFSTSKAMPSLPTSVFNRTLYHDILSLWFSGQLLSAPTPTPAALKKWFNVGASLEERSSFDSQCRKLVMPALDFLSPERFQLPKWESFDMDRQQANILSAPVRARIIADGAPIASAAQPYPDEKEVPDELDHADIARAFFLLLDQFPRNIFRDVKEQWRVYAHYDRLARALLHTIFNTVPSNESGQLLDLDRRDRLAHSPAHRFWSYMPLEHSEDVRDHAIFDQKLDELRAACEARGDSDGVEWVEVNLRAYEKQHLAVLERFGRYCHRNEALGRKLRQEEREYLESGGQTFGTG